MMLRPGIDGREPGALASGLPQMFNPTRSRPELRNTSRPSWRNRPTRPPSWPVNDSRRVTREVLTALPGQDVTASRKRL